MALLVWLPLRGDLKNIGLSGIAVTNNGATVNDNGKIGKCYQFGTQSSYITMPPSAMSGFSGDASVCFWLNITSFNTSWSTFFQAGLSQQQWNQYIFGFLRNNNSSSCVFVIGDGTNVSQQAYATPNLSINTWYHIGLTYKSGVCSIYINGVLYSDYSTSIVPKFSKITHITIGASNNHTAYQTNCRLNDFRIYDHCLSPKEVKEISKGLVIHYKMDDPLVERAVNLASESTLYTDMEEGQAYPASAWGGDAGTITYFKSGGYNNGPYKVVHKTASGSGGIYKKLANDIHIEAGKTYTMSVYVKASVPFTDQSYSFSINRSVGNRYITYGASIQYTTEWKRLSKTFTATADDAGDYGEISIIYKDMDDDFYVYFSCFQIEENDHATPYTKTSRNQTSLFDTSGYSNNGTILGPLMTDGDSPRYERSTKFNGVDSAVQVPYKVCNPDGVFTLNLWFKKDALGSKNYETLFGGPSGFEMDTRAGGAATLSFYMASVRGGNVFTPLDLNQWYMLTIVRDGVNELYYVNGELKKTIEAKPMPSGDYFIGAWKTAIQQNYYGLISDFRIYATALSADDVKELYDTAAIIDNKGDLLCFEAEEENLQTQVRKTGQILVNNLIEVNDAIYLPAGTYINTGLEVNSGDVFKAETVIRYKTGGTASNRDLMGFTSAGQGYWGVKADGTWEPHGTFSYTDADITKKNTIVYQHTASSAEHGEYIVGALTNTWSNRDKYIYRVRLYRNGVMERDMYPIKVGNKVGLIDILTHTCYMANNTQGSLEDSAIVEASIFGNKIEVSQLIEN